MDQAAWAHRDRDSATPHCHHLPCAAVFLTAQGVPQTLGGGILSIFEALVLGRALNPFVLNAKQPWAGIRIE